MTDNPLSKLGELSKPATVLVEKISEAVGGIFRPYQIVRVAKAEAEADRIRAGSQIEVTELHQRALHRFLEEEAKKQSNIEGITQKALPLLGQGSAPEKVENDWIANFFDKCRIVSDEDMQRLWSGVLACEANSPGSFSRKTVNLLSDLDKNDALLFTQLCGYGWVIGNVVPLVFDVQHDIYNRNGIHFNSIGHLETLGLVRFDNLAGFRRMRLPKKLGTYFYGRTVELTLPKDSDNNLEIGRVLLTQAGQELAQICGSKPAKEFFEFVYDRWANHGYVPKRTTEQGAPADVGADPLPPLS